MIDALSEDKILAGVRAGMAAGGDEARQPIGEWLSQHYVHPRGSGPTLHRSDYTPYWDHWLNLCTARLQGRSLAHDPHAHDVEQVWIVCANQLGKPWHFCLRCGHGSTR